MGKNQNSVVVLQIQVKFWWMIPMGVKYNHTKFEQETQGCRPETGFASGGPQFQKLQLRAKNSYFWAKKALEHIQNGQTKGNNGALHVRLEFPVSTSSLRPSNSMICPGNGTKRPPEAPNVNSRKPKIGHIFGYMAQNAIPRAPTPPATPHFLWFPPLKIAQTDAYTPIPRPTRLRQAASSSPNRWVPKWVNRVQ